MKKIFVSVSEFLDNGGSLNPSRLVYDSDGDFIGEFIKFNGLNMPVVGIYSHAYSIHGIYVEVDCTPIYI